MNSWGDPMATTPSPRKMAQCMNKVTMNLNKVAIQFQVIQGIASYVGMELWCSADGTQTEILKYRKHNPIVSMYNVMWTVTALWCSQDYNNVCSRMTWSRVIALQMCCIGRGSQYNPINLIWKPIPVFVTSTGVNSHLVTSHRGSGRAVLFQCEWGCMFREHSSTCIFRAIAYTPLS